MTTILKFYADWCAPCKMQSRIFQELSNEYDFVLVDIDIESNDDEVVRLVRKYDVKSIPTMVFNYNSENERVMSGLTLKETIKILLEELK